jgi:enoyl-CoA hydratase/carnithine racemase
MTEAPSATVDHQGDIAIIRYGNAPSGLISNKGAACLADAIERELARDTTRCLVITGAQDGIFIRHADVAQIKRAGDAVASGAVTPESFTASPFGRIGHILDTAEKPVIAAINGICLGGGLEIALACTLRIAATRCDRIGLPEIRLGIFPGAGGVARMARLVGAHRARRFALDGAIFGAEQALTIGLIDEVADDPLARAIVIATTYAKRDPAAVRAILELAAIEDDRAAIEQSMVRFGRLIGDSDEIRQRLAAFATGNRRLDELE